MLRTTICYSLYHGEGTLFRDKKLGHERILSIHPNEADSDGRGHLQLGVAAPLQRGPGRHVLAGRGCGHGAHRRPSVGLGRPQPGPPPPQRAGGGEDAAAQPRHQVRGQREAGSRPRSCRHLQSHTGGGQRRGAGRPQLLRPATDTRLLLGDVRWTSPAP